MIRTIGHNQSSTRINNRRLVLELLRNSEDITVSQVAKKIHLSKTTLWKIMDHFVQNNLAVSVGKAEAPDELGKKPELYRFNELYGYVISITIYGSSILLALTDARACVFYKEVIFIHENESLSRILELVANFIRKWQEPDAPNIKEGAKLLGIVIASSGVVDSEHGCSVTASRFHSWQTGAPLKDLLREQVEFKAPFYIDNYNRFSAFAEKTLGCARDKRNIVNVNAGYDGLGAGIIAENRIKRGPQYLTGEIGHMCLNPYDQEICHCGGKGCFEQLVSCDRLISKAEAARKDHADSMIYADDSRKVTLQAIFDASNAGDEWARLLMDDVIGWFAIGLYNINLVFNSEIIIISGDYRNAGPYFLKKLSEKIEQVSLLRMKKNFDIRYSSFDEEGPLRGGASYVLNEYFTRYRKH